MFRPTKLMKIFEGAWITISILAFFLALYKLFLDRDDPVYGYYLLFVCFLSVMMFLFKRRARRMMEKRHDRSESTHTNAG